MSRKCKKKDPKDSSSSKKSSLTRTTTSMFNYLYWSLHKILIWISEMELNLGSAFHVKKWRRGAILPPVPWFACNARRRVLLVASLNPQSFEILVPVAIAPISYCQNLKVKLLVDWQVIYPVPQSSNSDTSSLALHSSHPHQTLNSIVEEDKSQANSFTSRIQNHWISTIQSHMFYREGTIY